MKITLLQKKGKKQLKLKKGSTIKDVLKQEKVNVETIIPVLNKTVAHEKEKLSNADTLELLSAISGG
ncbi:MAG: MoaD/ThiS family protein [Candidatus Micrarchaeia archaeon]